MRARPVRLAPRSTRGAKLTKGEPRLRWGVQHDFRDIHDARQRVAQWRTLGAGWHSSHAEVPGFVDFWPMSFQTKREAVAEVKTLATNATRHSPHWRFRVVRLRIVVTSIRT